MFRLEAQFNPDQLTRQIQDDIDRATLETLIKVSSRAIEIARTRAAAEEMKVYENHTGNLESSTGFIITRDGKVVHRDFKLASEGTDKSTGMQTGLSAAMGVLREKKGWGIVLIAGMEYASWVEGKGFDVLSGGMRNFEQFLDQAFREIIVE